MREEISLTDCPQVLQDRIKRVEREHAHPFDIFSVQKSEYTPFADKSIVMLDYRVFVQYGYSIAIYRSCITTGGSPLDGEVHCSIIDMNEITTIATKAQWIGDDLKRILKPSDGR